MTSRTAVNRLQAHVRPAKIGHAGTLDPLATGVLVVAVGRATRLVPYVQRMEKTYVAEFELGKTSDTEDVCGVVTRQPVESPPTAQQVLDAAAAFVGVVRQRPPAFSALKVGGRRAYKLARAGESVELAERDVHVAELTVLGYLYPELVLRIRCGSGTYVRSLGRDVGELLGCGAIMRSLRRTAIGNFTSSLARSPDELTSAGIEAGLLSVRRGLADVPEILLAPEQAAGLPFGAKLTLPDSTAPELVAVDAEGSVLALLVRGAGGDYRPRVNFVARH